MEFFKRKKPNNEDGDDINKLIKELLNSHKKEYKNIENFLKYFLRYQNVEILSLSLKEFLNHLDLLKKEIDHEISYEENLGLKNINSHLEEIKEMHNLRNILDSIRP
jgi:F0F1-type ATP synthase delta subunit